MKLFDKEVMLIKKPIIEKYFKKNNWNISATSRDLGITRETLYSLIERYDIEFKKVKNNPIDNDDNFFLHIESKQLIKEMIERYLRENKCNKKKTAKVLEITTKTLLSHILYHDIQIESLKEDAKSA